MFYSFIDFDIPILWRRFNWSHWKAMIYFTFYLGNIQNETLDPTPSKVKL